MALAGCTSNPWFGVDTGADESEGTAATDEATGAADTGSSSDGPPTSGDTVGTASASGMTEAGESSTGVDPQSTGMSTDPQTTQGSDDETDTNETGEELCGNGALDEGEECDILVAPDSGCTPECQNPVCGDGYVYEGGGEKCDKGAENDDYGACTLDCQFAKCGDGFVQPGEVCDAGANNGKPEIMACASDCMDTYQHVLEIRVTGATYQGALTKNAQQGVYGADELCEQAFENQPGVWKALIVDGDKRIASATSWSGEGQSGDWVLAPYTIYVNINQDLNKKVIGVTGKERLLGKPGELLVNAIGLAEAEVWTGLNEDWTATEVDCENWTVKAEDKMGSTGESSTKDGKYKHVAIAPECVALRHLYCVQQPL